MENETDRVWYSEGRTVNLGNYESAKVDVGGSFVVPAGADRDDTFRALVAFVEAALESRLAALELKDPA